MTTISNVSRGAAVGVDYDVDMSNMTPQDVLAYCQTRINKLQDDIKKQADSQRKINQASEILTDLTQKLSQLGDGKVAGIDVATMRDAYSNAANAIAALDDPNLQKLAQSLRSELGAFDKGFNRVVHFSDGTTYKLNAQEDDSFAQKRHDAWVRWNAAGQPRLEKGDKLTEDMLLASEWEGDMFSGRDGVDEGVGKVPQNGGTIARVTFDDGNVPSTLMGHFRDDLKGLQGVLNENSQTNLDDLHNLTQQKQQALQIMQQMLQALVEQAKATQEWR